MLYFSLTVYAADEEIYIRLNQAGYLPDDIKTAVVFSNTQISDYIFYIRDAETLEEVYTKAIIPSFLIPEGFKHAYVLDFSSFSEPGRYIIDISHSQSWPFHISGEVFNDIADSLMLFFSVQRCGPTRPYLHLPCHLSDASVIRGEDDSSAADLTGGWHDAGDYIKFLNTTALTTYLLIFSYEFDKEKFGYDNDHNDVPDILDEAKVGLDWLLRAHYKKGKLITQVQDIRDHTPFWRMPENDSLQYDRPAFTSFGKNHIGIFSAALALGARIWKEKFLSDYFADQCLNAAAEMYSVRDKVPDLGSDTSAAYADKDFAGNLSLAAAELYLTTGDRKYLEQSHIYAHTLEPDYWWSWGNTNTLAFYRLAEFYPEYLSRIQQGLDQFNAEKNKSVFGEGTSYSWGTTNTFMGIALQSILFERLTSASAYDSLALYQRDFVLGRNRWGVCFINKIGSVYPAQFHSQIAYLNGGNFPGAVAGGPAPMAVLEKYNLSKPYPDSTNLNTSSAAYFDDRNNFITNEATIFTNAVTLFVMGYYSQRTTPLR